MPWTHIIIEGFCARKWSLKKDKYVYAMVSTRPFKTKKVLNKLYDKNYRTPKKPHYCPGDCPTYICLAKGCKHLAYSNAEKEDYKQLFKKYKK